MKKKIFTVLVAFIMLLGSLSVSAGEDVISGGISELSLAAERYYYTNAAISDMTITKVSDSLYQIYYYDISTAKGLTATLYLTAWGTWNLGDWTVNNSYISKTVIGGGTDWEYVFRVRNPVNGTMEFVGGNHGSEVLKSLSMYDAVTGEVFDLEVGESKYVNRLVITEHTSLLLGNLDHLPFANVTRKYTFIGNRIHLDCDIEFIRDVKMALSYSAMACVNKDFGRYATFSDSTAVTTGARGTCTKAYLGKTEAMSCTFSGDNPMATVKVGIYNKSDMTDNFSNVDKTFLWDMSEGYNKLYFSRGSLTERNLISEGTKWDFGTYWEINL